MDKSEKVQPLAELEAELNAAITAHDEAVTRESQARMERTNALNRLNRAQAAIDEALTARRKGSHPDTDWSRRETIGVRERAHG